jgi:hypothetical protein
LQIYVRENQSNEERNQEGRDEEGCKESPGQEEKVSVSRVAGMQTETSPPVVPGAFLFCSEIRDGSL